MPRARRPRKRGLNKQLIMLQLRLIPALLYQLEFEEQTKKREIQKLGIDVELLGRDVEDLSANVEELKGDVTRIQRGGRQLSRDVEQLSQDVTRVQRGEMEIGNDLQELSGYVQQQSPQPLPAQAQQALQPNEHLAERALMGDPISNEFIPADCGIFFAN